jgi:hypothetical protein
LTVCLRRDRHAIKPLGPAWIKMPFYLDLVKSRFLPVISSSHLLDPYPLTIIRLLGAQNIASQKTLSQPGEIASSQSLVADYHQGDLKKSTEGWIEGVD